MLAPLSLESLESFKFRVLLAVGHSLTCRAYHTCRGFVRGLFSYPHPLAERIRSLNLRIYLVQHKRLEISGGLVLSTAPLWERKFFRRRFFMISLFGPHHHR